jgi:hypothetical protein
MKQPRVWIHENRVRLFELLLQEIGEYDRNKYRLSSPTAPKGTSSKQEEKIYQRIYDQLLREDAFGCFQLDNPASFMAIKQQVAWTTSIQDLRDDTATTEKEKQSRRGQRKMQRQLRMAAYEAGWLTLNDILYLEDAAKFTTLVSGIDTVIYFTATPNNIQQTIGRIPRANPSYSKGHITAPPGGGKNTILSAYKRTHAITKRVYDENHTVECPTK